MKFSVNFAPAGGALGGRRLGGARALLEALDASPEVAAAVRGSVLAGLLAPSAGGAPVVIDQVLIASAAYGGAPPFFLAFNDSSPVNTAGNSAESIDALIDNLSSGGAAFNTSTTARRRRALLAAAGGARARAAGRQLELELQPGNPTAVPVNATALTFNIIATSPASAAGMAAALRDSAAGGGGDALAASIAKDASNATGVPLGAAVDGASVKLITLTYKRSRWGLFLEWLRAKITLIIGCAAAVAVVFGCAVSLQRWRAARNRLRKAVARARAERAEAARTQRSKKGTLKKVDRARWRRVRIALLRYLRAAATSKAALGALALTERARERLAARAVDALAKSVKSPHARSGGGEQLPGAPAPAGGRVPHGAAGRVPAARTQQHRDRSLHEKETTSNPHTMPTHTSMERTEDAWATGASGTAGDAGEDFAAAGTLAAAHVGALGGGGGGAPLSPSGEQRVRLQGRGGKLPARAPQQRQAARKPALPGAAE